MSTRTANQRSGTRIVVLALVAAALVFGSPIARRRGLLGDIPHWELLPLIGSILFVVCGVLVWLEYAGSR